MTLEEILEIIASHDTPPVADLGYCVCGTVWSIEAMAAQNFAPCTCPECGEIAIAVEKGKTQ